MVWTRRYFAGIHEAFGHVVRNFWFLVSLTLPASAQIVDMLYTATGGWDPSNLVFPYVYTPPGPTFDMWSKERLKIRQMLHTKSGAFQINGKDVNAASHATYSHALRNNELWCGVLPEVGWHLQEIMREGLHIFEPEGIEHFIENVHIHRNFFTNEADWSQTAPYDNLLETQHQEMLLMWGDMKKKYRDIEENVAAIKRERDRLNHTIANFLTTHMSSSVKITTRTERIQDLFDEHSSEGHDDRAITELVSRMKKI
jgi:hypothetical protein